MTEPDQDPRHELAELARAVRGLVEWHESCGASGLLSDAPASEVLGFLDPARPRTLETRRPAPDFARPDVARTEAVRPEALRPEAVRPDAARPEASAMARPEAPPAARPDAARAAAISARADVSHVAGGDRAHRPDTFADAPVPTFAIEEKRKRLGVLADKVRDCKACVLCEARTQTVFARGDASAELVFIGEGPGVDEDAQGAPFVGKAGQLLDKMIAAMGMRQDEVYICNIVKCRPPENREPLPQEVRACSAYLAEQLELVRPKVIVTLGNVPLKALFDVQGITKARGTWRLYKGTTPVMPTYHPAYVLRNPTQQVKGDVWNDLKLVMKQLGRAIPARATTT